MIWWQFTLPAVETAHISTCFFWNESSIRWPMYFIGHHKFQNCIENTTNVFWALIPISITEHLGMGRVALQCVPTCIWCDYLINFTSACHSNNNIIKCMVIIAAGSSLISGQIGWSPFSCRIIAKPLTWTWIDTPAGFPLHCEWAPQTPIRHNGHGILSSPLLC